MNVRQRKHLIRAGAGCVLLAGAAILAAGLMTPVKVHGRPTVDTNPRSSGAKARRADGAEPGQHAERGELAELTQLCAMPLRGPLYDPPPTGGAGPPTPTRRPMTAALIGIIYEPGHAIAVFQTAAGNKKLCAEGESVDDPVGKVTVVKVEADRVTVQYAGNTVELKPPPRR